MLNKQSKMCRGSPHCDCTCLNCGQIGCCRDCTPWGKTSNGAKASACILMQWMLLMLLRLQALENCREKKWLMEHHNAHLQAFLVALENLLAIPRLLHRFLFNGPMRTPLFNATYRLSHVLFVNKPEPEQAIDESSFVWPALSVLKVFGRKTDTLNVSWEEYFRRMEEAAVRKTAAACKIQACVRRWIAICELRKYRAACKIQTCARRRIAICKWGELKKALRIKALMRFFADDNGWPSDNGWPDDSDDNSGSSNNDLPGWSDDDLPGDDLPGWPDDSDDNSGW